MDNNKTPKYYIEKIIKDIEFCINHLKDSAIEEFNEDEVLSSAISFIKICVKQESGMTSKEAQSSGVIPCDKSML